MIHVGPLDAEKIAKAVWLYVFRILITASLLHKMGGESSTGMPCLISQQESCCDMSPQLARPGLPDSGAGGQLLQCPVDCGQPPGGRGLHWSVMTVTLVTVTVVTEAVVTMTVVTETVVTMTSVTVTLVTVTVVTLIVVTVTVVKVTLVTVTVVTVTLVTVTSVTVVTVTVDSGKLPGDRGLHGSVSNWLKVNLSGSPSAWIHD